MRKGAIGRTKEPKMPIRIEYSDERYTYISSAYGYRELKADIENIKVPITIIYSVPTA